MIAPFALPFMARALAEAVLLGALAGVVGVFVLLRRLAFVAEALSHAVFPGVVVGYLAAGAGGVGYGALAAAALATVLLTLRARLSEDTALAVLMGAFFAVGVILVSRRPSYTADLTTFLFGRILTVDAADLARTAVLAGVALGTLALLGKELLLAAFDRPAAAALGYRTAALDAVLNVLVAVVVVAAVQAVGTVLSVGLLVVPAAAARLLTDRLALLIAVSAGSAALAGWLGLALAWTASVDHGVPLAAGGTIVAVLVAWYAAARLLTLAVR